MTKKSNNNRRKFLSLITASLGLATFNPLNAFGKNNVQSTDLDAWFGKLKGKHKMVFDTITPINGFQIVWPHTFLESHNENGTTDPELNAIIVLRNRAIALALEDRIWKKYKLGKFYKVIDPALNIDADRNLYWNPPASELPEPGTSLKDLMARGVMICVCEKALTLNSNQIAKSKNLDPVEVKKDWFDGIIPGIQRVPSGVWALNKIQELGASYCYAG
jgi:hypothetical protein